MNVVRGALLFFTLLAVTCILPAAASEACLDCHGEEGITVKRDGEPVSLFVDAARFSASVHGDLDCSECHTDTDEQEPIHQKDLRPVNCSTCHSAEKRAFDESIHGTALGEDMPRAPSCRSCHGKHDILPPDRSESRTNRMKIPGMCGECHRERRLAKAKGVLERDILNDYSGSVHGKGMEEKGLIITAICTDCHGSHSVFRHNDPRSSVNPANIASTCGKCHVGIYEKYSKGVHFAGNGGKDGPLPACADCHSSHNIFHVDEDKFTREVAFQCGSCHTELSRTYMETMHGKANRLGYSKAARCSDCHGAHGILHVKDPDSMVGEKNILQTCRKCHANPGKHFTSYLTHATIGNKDKYPVLYYTHSFMLVLLIGVFGFFGLHTLLWIPRSVQAVAGKKKKIYGDRFVVRFTLSQRITHLIMVITFLLLALTGMMLKFSAEPWAGIIAAVFGGVPGAGSVHRMSAVLLFGYFFYHLYDVARERRRTGAGWGEILFGEDSMIPGIHDAKDLYATLKWFVGAGEKPSYGRWTYWEKFDYFAVFWGVVIIGCSGLMLWFAEFFTNFLPGWMINVATIIHSEEALLAVGFIFTIHFFPTHFRGESFPMDPSIFTGKVPLEKYKEERGRHYEKMEASGELEKHVTEEKTPPALEKLFYLMGGLFLLTGVLLILLIFYSAIFGFGG